MIIAIIYIFLCDISSTVENYFQKILSPAPPEKIQSPLFTKRPLSYKVQKGVGWGVVLHNSPHPHTKKKKKKKDFRKLLV